MTQDQALSLLKTGANVFLTGEPGSGKTYTVNEYVAWLKSHGIQPAITASTGIAATHIGGYTIHSWSGIGVHAALTKHDLQRMQDNQKLRSRVRSAHTLIIDEVSMLSATTLGLVDVSCRALRGSPAPFGGLQVVLVGDFFQLPPVVRMEDRAENNEIRDMSYENGKEARTDSALFSSSALISHTSSLFCFDSPAWRALSPIVCYLHEQHRQEDPAFLDLLSAIRRHEVEDFHRELLATRYAATAPINIADADGLRAIVPKLFSHNLDVDRVNGFELTKVQGEVRSFAMAAHGPKELVAQLKRGCLSPELLQLKIGAPVMFTKNDYLQHQYVNGSLGTVVGFSKEDNCPIVVLKTGGGAKIYASAAAWHIEDGERVLAGIMQVPLRLAWAITVHKSQGMSLDAAHMDLRGAFEHGQGYVALSRVRTLAGLTLAGWNERALEVHPEILVKDSEFRVASREAEKELATLSEDDLETRHNNFIIMCGGKIKPEPAKSGKTDAHLPQSPRSHTERIDTLAVTLTLIKNSKTIAEISKTRSFTERTVISHLEQLYADGKLSPNEIKHLGTNKEKIIEEIQTAMKRLWAKTETRPLKPIFDEFGGHFPYDLLRLARLLLED